MQGELEQVIARLFDLPHPPYRIVGSGRTDTGVHATGQVAAVDAPSRWTPVALRRAMNALLPPDVWVADAADAPADFHPRYDAIQRAYVYRIGTHPHARSPFHARWCWPLAKPLDEDAISVATAALPGDHSFRAFAKAGQEERGDRCTIHSVDWHTWDPLGLQFHISANRFLHHMVRYLVGTLAAIGQGLRPASDMAAMLQPDTPLTTSPPAPAQGLYLCQVTYP